MSKRYRNWCVLCAIWAVVTVSWLVIALWQGDFSMATYNLIVAYWVYVAWKKEQDIEELRDLIHGLTALGGFSFDPYKYADEEES